MQTKHPKWSEWLTSDKLILLQGWARDGLTDEQIAHNMGIGVRTLYEWKKRPECQQITQTLKSGKEVVDYAVENALLKNAMNGDTTAQIYWLKNRRPEKWRDRREPEMLGETIKDVADVLVRIKKVADNEQGNRDNGEAG